MDGIGGKGELEINGGHGSAVSLQLIVVGTRHCRVLYIIPVQPELILFGNAQIQVFVKLV